MRVLIVSQYFWPENFWINTVAQTLSEKNCDVVVLTGQPNYPEGRIFPGYHTFGMKKERYQSVLVNRVPLLARGQGVISLAMNYLCFILSASFFGPFKLRGQKYDAIFVYGISPILAALPALLIGKVKRTPVVIWVQDLWPESLSATGYINNKWVLWGVEKIVRFIYRHADLLLVQSEAFIEDVTKLSGSTPVAYFPNSVDPRFAQVNADEPLPFPQLENKFIVLFAGNIGTAQAVETIIEAASRLQDISDIHFVLVGDGSMRDWAQQQVQNRKLKNIDLPGKFPIEQMPTFMSQASALLVSLKDQAIFAKTVPNKIQAYLAAGRPIIAALNGEGARVVCEAQAGIAVEAENPQALAKACLDLARTSPEQLTQMGSNGYKYYFAHYNHDTLIDDLIKHFRTCSEEKRSI